MSACSRVQASSHWVSPSTMARHSTHRNRRVFSARCSTLPLSAGAKGGCVGGNHFTPAWTPPPQHPLALRSCCPPTGAFLLLFLFLLAFGLFGRLQFLLPPSAVPCKGQTPPGKGSTGSEGDGHRFWPPLGLSHSLPHPLSCLKTSAGAKGELRGFVPNPIVAIRESTHTPGTPQRRCRITGC